MQKIVLMYRTVPKLQHCKYAGSDPHVAVLFRPNSVADQWFDSK